MGECFHWFDAPRALEVLHSVAKESDAIVALWGYSLFNAISTDVFKDSVQVDQRYLEDFDKIIYDRSFKVPDENLSALYKKYSEVINTFYDTILPYQAIDIDLLKYFYHQYDFTSKHFDRVSKTLSVFDKQTNAKMLYDFMITVSGYRAMLEKEGIVLGDEDRDPLQIFKT